MQNDQQPNSDQQQVSPEPNMYEGDKPAKSSPAKIIMIVALLFATFAAGAAAVYFLTKGEPEAPLATTQTRTSTETVQEESDNEQQAAPEEMAVSEPEVIETDDFTLELPEGFSATSERQFTATGAPQRTYSYVNTETNDYFEINVTPADSGINADFVWTYVYSSGTFTLDKSDSTVCLPEEDDWCETSGNNGRLDAAIFSNTNQEINGKRYYFTFGNSASETVGDLSYVDTFLDAISF